jgi:hypothetical protein
MANKRHKPEEIVQKPRQVDVPICQGLQRADAIREARICATNVYWSPGTKTWSSTLHGAAFQPTIEDENELRAS